MPLNHPDGLMATYAPNFALAGGGGELSLTTTSAATAALAAGATYRVWSTADCYFLVGATASDDDHHLVAYAEYIVQLDTAATLNARTVSGTGTLHYSRVVGGA